MITKLTLRNFKSIGEQTYNFTKFDLFVGRNNSGKSTILQAMAIWQFCVDEFHRVKRGGTSGIQVVCRTSPRCRCPNSTCFGKTGLIGIGR